ncbi:MAG: D-2-hydroxyacid dehydrogenase [Clostridiales bacterium]|nr:D-2-hydroxyacid dehydrogenase [Clostridiales bacterium]
MINILMKRLLDEEDIQILMDKYDVNIILADVHEYPAQEVLDTIEVYFGWMKKDTVEMMPNLKWIHIFSAGVDCAINILKQEENPPKLSNNTGAYGVQLSEHSLAFALALNKNLPKAIRDAENEMWTGESETREIYGSTVGVVGLGDAGVHSAQLFHALGARVYGQKLDEIQKPIYIDKMYYGNDGLDEMLPLCDYVIITLPGTEKTRNLFDRKRLMKIKKGAIITNIGRGYIIDCDALADLLNSGHIGGAGLDVTEPEPLPEGHKLWHAQNVIITPHTAGPSPGKSKRAREVFQRNLEAYIIGQRMPTEIDFDKGY